jgi:hypothetical protein
MRLFDSWRPKRLEEHGELQISTACDLLAARMAELTPEQHRRTQDWLVQ